MKAWRYLFLTLMACGPVHADIYRYVNADGVTTFSNVRPARGAYVTVVKEAQPAAKAETAVAPWMAPPRTRGYGKEQRSRYAGHIHAAARASNVDPLLVHAVISAESGYNPVARSRAGAVGLMQLMPETAARYGGGIL